MKNKDIIISDNAIQYFEEHNITCKEWNNYCREKFNLVDGDHVFYEGNRIGYRRINSKA